ncbi:MAG: NADH-quinone oxidoreductase subunit A [Armatimonadetes bacterium]|nr:NADH-quinone oxidoreductase subunit A [Armatimonadota bacterium]
MPEGPPGVTDFQAIAWFAILAILFVVVALGLSRLIQPHRPKPEKLTTYECGERPIGQAWSQFNVRYYIFALVFVVFDIETIFIYPWAVRLRNFADLGIGPFMFVEMLVFLGILVLGLVYAWRKGVLKWV